MPKMENLNNITRVRFNDYTEYDSEKCNNGGCYGFWGQITTVLKTETGRFPTVQLPIWNTALVVAHSMTITTMRQRNTLAEILRL